jgi:hypothetical protein
MTRYQKIECEHCNKEFASTVIKRHVKSCYLNPVNLKHCEACGTVIMNKGAITCSVGCYNSVYRSGKNNPNYKGTSYKALCIEEHGRSCIVCGFDYITSVHHVNENHYDNSLNNLVPLCPNHHHMLHSKHRDLVQPRVDEYLKEKYGEPIGRISLGEV